MHDALSNEELVEKLKENYDGYAFKELYERFIPLFKSLAASHDIPTFELEDYFQEGRIVIHKAIGLYSIEKNAYFAGFLKMKYQHRLYNLLRHHCAAKRGGTTRPASLDHLINNDEDFEHMSGDNFIKDNKIVSPEALVAIREKTNNYYIDLSDLEGKVMCCYLDGLSIKETAEKLQVKETQARSAYDRCRQKLRKLL